MRSPIRAIALTGLIVGAMDITSALILTLMHGSTATRLGQFIATGLLGRRAFEGGAATALLGYALHFLIALALVAVFYIASRRFPFLQERPVVSGLLYGLIVFAVMNLIVLPLSAARPRHAVLPDLIQVAIHMFIIGLPTALLLRRFSGASAR